MTGSAHLLQMFSFSFFFPMHTLLTSYPSPHDMPRTCAPANVQLHFCRIAHKSLLPFQKSQPKWALKLATDLGKRRKALWVNQKMDLDFAKESAYCQRKWSQQQGNVFPLQVSWAAVLNIKRHVPLMWTLSVCDAGASNKQSLCVYFSTLVHFVIITELIIEDFWTTDLHSAAWLLLKWAGIHSSYLSLEQKGRTVVTAVDVDQYKTVGAEVDCHFSLLILYLFLFLITAGRLMCKIFCWKLAI